MPVEAYEAGMRHHYEQQKQALMGPAMVCLTLTNIHRKRRAPYRMEDLFPDLAGRRKGASTKQQMLLLAKVMAAATRDATPPTNVVIAPWGKQHG